MPFISLESLRSRSFYKAKAIKSKSNIVNEDDATFAAENQTSKPEIEELVNIAEVAEEVMHSESELTNLQKVPITSAGVKAPRVPLYYRIQSNILRPAEIKVLRRAVVRSIRESSNRSPKPKASNTHAEKSQAKALSEKPEASSIKPQALSQAVATDGFRDLRDGDYVQIRQHRTPASIAHPLTEQVVSKKTRRKHTLKLLQRARRFSKRTRTKVDAIACQLRHKPTRAELINAESRLGSTIFGPVPAGHRREFFHDQENVWIWHEDWRDQNNQERVMTVRYEVRPSGVYKKLSAGHYVKLVGRELDNFRQATHVYLYIIKQKLYRYAA